MRRFLPGLLIASLLALGQLTSSAQTADPPWRHAVAGLEEPKYPPDFKHFNYVNPDAPKGGVAREGITFAFDSFNVVIPRGVPMVYTELWLNERLFVRSSDEILAAYGNIAEAIKYPDDYSWASFRLRDSARWHDGTPITVEDVIWSFEVWTQNDPSQRAYYRNVEKVEKTGEREVTFRFINKNNRENPAIMSELMILPKHWWTGKDANGNQRDITQTTLEPPLGSGPYRIGAFTPGRSITFERVKDWWGKDLPINVGRYNFDQIRYEVYRDETVEFEAFKADQFDWRSENSARQWSTQYDFPAIRDGRVIREIFPITDYSRVQAFTFNLRRDKFKDPRVRRAFNYAWDFEELNKAIFFGLYKRVSSYFFGTELASSGVPEGQELEILNTVKDLVPPDLFTKPYMNPVGGTPDAQRANLREANRLLAEAGWVLKGNALVNAKTGERFKVEFLYNSATLERLILPYKAALERLGFEVTLRLVDSSQYQQRLNTRDFDIITSVQAQSLSPGNEQRDFWGSEAAGDNGSRNRAGIRDPAVDKLIERIVYAKDRAELVAATHALDRVLLWNNYMVPSYTLDETWTARWDRFGHPTPLPSHSYDFPQIWWWDEAKAAKVGSRQ